MTQHYSESKYSVESVSGIYLENGWSDQHWDFSVELVIEIGIWQAVTEISA